MIAPRREHHIEQENENDREVKGKKMNDNLFSSSLPF